MPTKKLFQVSKANINNWASNWEPTLIDDIRDRYLESIKDLVDKEVDDAIEKALAKRHAHWERIKKLAVQDIVQTVTSSLIRDDIRCGPELPGEIKFALGGFESSLTPHEISLTLTLQEIAEDVADLEDSEREGWRTAFASALAAFDRDNKKT